MYCYRLIKSPTVFIGKKELSKIPLFGFFFKRSSILVDRKSLKSKKNVLELSRQYLKRNIGVCIYPEGGIPKNENIILGKFKQGAFSLAIESGIDVLPVTFANNRKYLPDFFKGGRPGVIRATVHEPINVAGMSKKDINLLSDKVHSLLLKELETYRKKT
jgi:1-acyl-sn-glycerol-3-phosphate acyltransferase